MDGKCRTTMSIGCIQTKDSYNLPQSSSQNHLHPLPIESVCLGFEVLALGSRCPHQVQGIHVGLKASMCSNTVCWRGIWVGFKGSVLGSRCLCWIQDVWFEASVFVSSSISHGVGQTVACRFLQCGCQELVAKRFTPYTPSWVSHNMGLPFCSTSLKPLHLAEIHQH